MPLAIRTTNKGNQYWSLPFEETGTLGSLLRQGINMQSDNLLLHQLLIEQRPRP